MSEKIQRLVVIFTAALVVVLLFAVGYFAHKTIIYKAAFDAYVQQDQQIQMLQATQRIIGQYEFPPVAAKQLKDIGFQVKSVNVQRDSTAKKSK